MSIYNEILEAVVGLIQNTNENVGEKIGALPVGNSVAVYLINSQPETTFQDKGIQYNLNVTLHGKNTNPKTISDLLNNIHLAITQMTEYPYTDDWQINDISTNSLPQMIQREDSGEILFGSSLNIRVYVRKGE